MRIPILAFALSFLLAGGIVGAPTIFFVRHAEKATDGHPQDPDLTDAGRARAASLATLLKDAGVTAVYVTEFKRTQQTGEPLATANALPLNIVSANDGEALIEKLRKLNGNALVVGHSNTIPKILEAFGVKTPPSISETDYDNLFVLTPEESAQLLHLHYR